MRWLTHYLEDLKYSKAEIVNTIDNVQLGANTVQRRVSELSGF